MVPLSRAAEVAATYYSLAGRYYARPTSNEHGDGLGGYIYVVYLPSKTAIDTEAVARAANNNNVGTREVTPLSVDWPNVIGWRRMLPPEQCRAGGDEREVTFGGGYVANADCKLNVNTAGIDAEELQAFQEFITSGTITVFNSSRL
jgi:hypothetical protein